ncbi:MAG: nuclear transport factor 2 family protein [Bacilli bacterium]
MTKKEILNTWFKMWILNKPEGIETLFNEDAIYFESVGTHYVGMPEIKRWFQEWNKNNRVKNWDVIEYEEIGEHVYLEWYFKMQNKDGKVIDFNGISKAEFVNGKIQELREFISKIPNKDPFAN